MYLSRRLPVAVAGQLRQSLQAGLAACRTWTSIATEGEEDSVKTLLREAIPEQQERLKKLKKEKGKEKLGDVCSRESGSERCHN